MSDVKDFRALIQSGMSPSEARKALIDVENKTPPRLLAAIKNRQHLKRATSDGTVTFDSWLEMMQYLHGRCIVPGCPDPGDTQDHVVPVAEGGLHSIHNLQPMCQHHNSSKGAKIEDHRPKDWPWL